MPELDYIDILIMEAFGIIQRSRRFMESVPLPITIGDINEYIEAFPTALDRDIFYQCIFALDDMFLEHHYEKNKPKGGKGAKNSKSFAI